MAQKREAAASSSLCAAYVEGNETHVCLINGMMMPYQQSGVVRGWYGDVVCACVCARARK